MREDYPLSEGQLLKRLRVLFARYGYTRYRMSRFEEYDLYARNRDFLVSDQLITFTDTTGRLMALKPDVTLSIVRGATFSPDTTQKLYYEEKVYRVGGFSHNYQEITQAGIECIGAVDDYALAEALLLAVESLKSISPDVRLCVSHLGVITELMAPLGLTHGQQAETLSLIGAKNAHGLRSFLLTCGCAEEAIQPLLTASALAGAPQAVLPQLEHLGCTAQAAQLRRLFEALRQVGSDAQVLLDLSVVNDLGYYSGLVFHGFVAGVPARVLSGGVYDKLVRKLNRTGSAVGFAVYVDELSRLWPTENAYDTDILLRYEDGCSPAMVLQAVQQLSADGSRVLAEAAVPQGLTCRQRLCLHADGEVSTDAEA